MKLKNKIVGLFAFLFLSTQASALVSLMVEPYVGFNVSGSGDNGSTITDISYSGLTYGGRLGVSTIAGLWVAGDFNLQSGTDIERTVVSGSTTTITTDESDITNIGATIGYDLPLLFRVWGTYYFSSTIEDKDGTGAGTELKGDGFAFGAGYTGLPFVSLNVEYRILSYDEFENQPAALGVASGTLANARDHNQIVLSVSVPWDF